jgi:hypothetical protein
MRHYLGVAKKERVTGGEVGAVQAIVMAVSACRVRSQFGEVSARKE